MVAILVPTPTAAEWTTRGWYGETTGNESIFTQALLWVVFGLLIFGLLISDTVRRIAAIYFGGFMAIIGFVGLMFDFLSQEVGSWSDLKLALACVIGGGIAMIWGLRMEDK